MPREVYAHRTIAVFYDDAIQKIIDDKPSTCQVYHTSHNTVLGEPTPTLVATFQCRLDVYRPSTIGLRAAGSADHAGTLGKASPRTFLLLARNGTDYNGSPVIIEHSDRLIVDGVQYRCLLVTTFTEKVEAVIDYIG
jgi:hypothetical protein